MKMRRGVKRLAGWAAAALCVAALVGCGDDKEPELPPFDPENSNYSGIGGLPQGGAAGLGGRPSGGSQPDAGAQDASVEDVPIPDSGEIDILPDAADQ